MGMWTAGSHQMGHQEMNASSACFVVVWARWTHLPPSAPKTIFSLPTSTFHLQLICIALKILKISGGRLRGVLPGLSSS